VPGRAQLKRAGLGAGGTDSHRRRVGCAASWATVAVVVVVLGRPPDCDEKSDSTRHFAWVAQKTSKS
jgi:hypothetical protein